MKKTLMAVAIMATIGLTGCATRAQNGMIIGGLVGAIAGGPIGSTAGVHIGAGIAGLFLGGVIGEEIGRHMDQRDLDLAQKAAESGKKTTWTNTTTNNTFVVTPTDKGDSTSVKTDMTKDGKTTSETVVVKKKIRE